MSNEVYLSPGSLPKDTILCEPSKLQQFTVINLWNYWKKKQAREEPGLVFSHARAQDRREPPLMRRNKGKKKAVEFMDESRQPTPDNTSQASQASGASRHIADPSKTHLPPPRPLNAIAGPSRTDRSSTPDHGPAEGLEERGDNIEVQDDEEQDKEEDEPSLAPDCPKSHMKTKRGRFLYLKTLSDNDAYRAMLKSMERIKVCNSHGSLNGSCSTHYWHIGRQHTAS
jgi:hypothetical protein